MKHNTTQLIIIGTLAAIMLAACDSGPSPQPTQPAQQTTIPTTLMTQVATTIPTFVDAAPITPQPTPVEDNPSPTPVTATGTGEQMTALQALAILKPQAIAWQPDVRLAMLANVRPGQQKRLMTGALGDPDVFEPTPGGLGRNWTLVAVSPLRGALAVSMDGTQVDLLADGKITNEMLAGFSDPQQSALGLATLDTARLVNSDKLAASTQATIPAERVGIALIAPNGLGIGPLPTPQAGGTPPLLAYEMYNSDPAQQSFIIFNAYTGAVILDSARP
jgi:hypothetical protein